jgi:DNA-binding HxlR family transcriptional regulator
MRKATTLCPIALSQDVVGDRWSILILRELFMTIGRFEDLLAQTEATPQMLAGRLKRLEEAGMLERRTYSQRPIRYEYVLTEKGRAFYPVIFALRAFGEKWCKPPGNAPAILVKHKPCGRDPGSGSTCQVCNAPIKREDLETKLSPQYALERTRRERIAKAARRAGASV